jgi:glycogen phosphorylase
MAKTELRASLNSLAGMQGSIRRHVRYSLGKAWEDITPHNVFTAVALVARDRMIDLMLETEERYRRHDVKRLYYLSIEYLIGKSLDCNLRNLGLRELCSEALSDLGVELDPVEESEPDAALGNGGLGRLASCFLDSLATLSLPACGYGINYEFGLFRQEIDSGYQREKPDNWLVQSSPWQIPRPEEACVVPVYGRIEHGVDRQGGYNPMWMDWKVLIGIPHDMLIPGYGGRTVNVLRLFSARSSRDFDINIFNDGDYFKAVEQKIASETISKVLYPSDSVVAGQELRLLQEYFLVGCALRDITRRFEQDHTQYGEFADKAAIQLNDTHPALAIPELMRILVDEKSLSWDQSWEITQKTFGFTNHTLLPEALEKWPVPMIERVLPRHLQIVYEINHRLLRQVRTARPEDVSVLERVSLIEESVPKQMRMANLAATGSHSINGVSEAHSELLKTRLFSDFHRLFPDKLNNKTNGVTQRRWLLQANPPLAELIQSVIGDGWITDLEQLRKLEPYADDRTFHSEFRRVKCSNKKSLARYIQETTRITVDPDSLFDVQVKRIHAYKRQVLNVMHIIHEYLSLVEDGKVPAVPRTYVFAGKAAPGYWLAKQVIKLIHNVGRIVNSDGRSKDFMKVVFVPDYRVSVAEKIIPAADLSEQISTAGYEASGTGNMKLALNGALTIGTVDGANIEIFEEAGKGNYFAFGLTVDEVQAVQQRQSYHPADHYNQDSRARRVTEALRSNLFCPNEPSLFSWAFDMVMSPTDEYLHLADFSAYLDAHDQAAQAFRQPDTWAQSAILNVARMGKFSSDRTVSEYAQEIWNIHRT